MNLELGPDLKPKPFGYAKLQQKLKQEPKRSFRIRNLAALAACLGFIVSLPSLGNKQTSLTALIAKSDDLCWVQWNYKTMPMRHDPKFKQDNP